jgi:hypothetical protein
MSETRESGVGARESEMADPPTADSRLPTPREPHWPMLYGLVMAELLLLILIFYAFTKAFA